jgi:hypothetical protein
MLSFTDKIGKGELDLSEAKNQIEDLEKNYQGSIDLIKRTEYTKYLKKCYITAYLLFEQRIMNKRCFDIGIETKFIVCETHACPKRAKKACLLCERYFCTDCFSDWHKNPAWDIKDHESIEILAGSKPTDPNLVDPNLTFASAKFVMKNYYEDFKMHLSNNILGVLVQEKKGEFGDQRFETEIKESFEWHKIEYCRFESSEAKIYKNPNYIKAWNLFYKGKPFLAIG